MRNIKITIEYKGNDYCGWQAQNARANAGAKPSVQETIEKAIRKIFKKKIHLCGSGRTDSGAHALRQVANFKISSGLLPQKIKSALNANLPKSIRIINAEYAPADFHSRFSAKSKTYRYIILNQNFASAIFNGRCLLVGFPLDISLMRRAAKHLVGRHDFRAFCSVGSNNESTVRRIYNVSIKLPKSIFLNDVSGYKFICIDIQAEGFLYNMVRNIVGTLVEIGRKRFEQRHILRLFKEKNRALCGPCVPAKGLYLCDVRY